MSPLAGLFAPLAKFAYELTAHLKLFLKEAAWKKFLAPFLCIVSPPFPKFLCGLIMRHCAQMN